MILSARDIAEITRLLDESQFSELKLEIGEFKLKIRRGGASARSSLEGDEEFGTPTQTGASVEPEQAPHPREDSHSGPGAGEVDVPAPLLGNFYQAPRPSDPPFVQPGDTITEDSVIGIIEVMKLMNSVRAGVAGTVATMLVENGTTVEKDQPLIRVKVD